MATPDPWYQPLFLSLLWGNRAKAALWGPWRTVWNAWCSRVKGFLAQDRDPVVYGASGVEVPASHPRRMDGVEIRGGVPAHRRLLGDKAFTNAGSVPILQAGCTRGTAPITTGFSLKRALWGPERHPALLV